MKRLLIECTYVYEHPDLNSGIQRVVRSVVQHLEGRQGDVECIPVIMQDGQLKQVLELIPPRVSGKPNLMRRLIHGFDHARLRFWGLHSWLVGKLGLAADGTPRRALFWGWKLGSLSMTLPLRTLLWLERRLGMVRQRSVPLEIRPGDVFLMLDSSWHVDFYALAESMKAQGIRIVSVIYDLIPLTHSQFCDAGLTRVFDRWFDWVVRTADGFIAISETIRDEVRAEVVRRLGAEEAQKRLFDHFYLGSELDQVEKEQKPDPALVKVFESGAPVYLMVSTIEPRKNHAYLLRAFEQLWAAGSQARLCIIGKIGWKSEDLIGAIHRHPRLNRQLFMFNRLDDTGLEYAYAKARALVFPSHSEGFGLPLVEAMQRGLPVMASDIPVFREIGQDFMAYFDLDDPASLARLVEAYEAGGRFPASGSLAQWRWIGWREASLQLLERTMRDVAPLPVTQAGRVDANCA
ncbi:glycosyltransferase family 4 protein [Pseudomonas citronellolis]|uniref:glycosyltransferase family 4 protein n=1 Tax=Pseudomonas citronellolis TaxID=53408 RepID=UPI000778BA2A|nr:glycosyltransferase family 1 protein [Pseudomonas citronellolis]AMO73682.1 Glycogen synthase [Pseudomonas citronellolis]